MAAAFCCVVVLAGELSAALEAEPSDPCTISGTPGADVLNGTPGDDVICGFGGDDVLLGVGGNDRLLGGSGNDRLQGGGDNDRLRGGAGDDRLSGDGGNDNLRGGAGADRMSGGPGRDLGDYLSADEAVSLSSGNGANDGAKGEGDQLASDVENLRGGSGNDSLQGNAGANWLHGFGGNDRVRGGMGNDRLYGGMGRDALDARDAAAFTDAVFCGGGGGDGAMADTGDRVGADCENVNQNHAPTDLSLRPASVGENEPAATTVGTLTATDADAADTHAYSLVAGTGSGDNGSFTLAGTTVRTSAVFDYETKSGYSIRVRATDALNAGFEKQFTISVTDKVENINPVAVDDSETTSEDTQLELPASGAGSPAANDTDADSDPLTVTAVANPSGGAVSLLAGTIRFDPAANLCGTGAGGFDYTVSDGRGGTDAGHVTVDLTCVADAPTAVDDSATLAEGDGATAIDVLANDTDVDGGPIAVDTVTQPANGTVVITGDGTGLTYEPDPNYCNDPPGTAPDTFTYTLAPGGSQATVSVTVDCFDDPPTAVNDTATVAEDSGATAIDVLANDTDIDGGPIAVDTVTQPANGTVVITGGGTGLTYEPAANFCGPNSFTYTLNGGSSATVSVTVTCVDDLPLAVNDSATVAEDSGATAIDVLANDTDIDGGPKTVEAKTDGTNGTVVITGGGTGLTYQPAANFCGSDSFTYTLNGGSTATVSITVTCVDDAPTAVDDAATVAEDAPATAVDVLANDTDPDGGLKMIGSASDPANGTVVITVGGAGLTYQPDPNYCNAPPGTTPDTFTYTLNGGSTATVSITVTCVDDPPTAVDDTATVLEDAAATAVDVLANDTDPDGGPKTIGSASDPANGTVVITGGGTGLTYQPDPNYCNAPPGTSPDTFTYTLNGGSTATVSITVTCVDDPPVAVNDSATVLEDAAATAVSVLANDTDFDGGVITILSASDPANGTVVITGGGLGLTYQPDPNYCNAPPGTTPDTFTYTLNGGSTATVSMTVTCVPEAPVVDNSAGNTSYTENGLATPIDSAVTVSDPDPGATITGATVQITVGYAGAQDVLALAGVHPGITPSVSGDTLALTGPASPAAYQAALRDVTYRNSSESPSTAPRTATFTVTDETARTGSDTKSLTVVAVEDPPVAVNDNATVLEDAAATAVPVLANDTDVDGGTITIGSASDPANGTVVVTGGGTGLTYQPDPNYCNNPPGTTPDTFTYTLNGGSTATVSMTVTCVNDAPVADDETFSGANGAIGNTALVVNDPDDAAPNPTHPKKTISGDILAGDTDVDGPGPLTVTPETRTTNDGGSVTIESDGDFTFHPAATTSCTDTSDFFDYTVTDGHTPPPAGMDTGRVTIAISGCVWYVNNNHTGVPDNAGTSAAPFDTLDQAEAASGANHTVFVFDGNNTSSGYGSNGYAMNAGERLIGEHEGLVVGADTLQPANPGAHPTLTALNADVIDLDDGNEVRGLNVDPQGTGGGIAGSAGDTGGGTIDDVNVTDSGTAGTQPGLELDSTTGTFNITNLVVNTNGATGVRLNSAGTVNMPSGATISITSTGAPGLVAIGTNMGTSVFDAITSSNSATGGVSLDGTTGTTLLGDGTGTDLAVTTSSGSQAALRLNNAGSVTVDTFGTDNVSATGGPAVDVTGTAGATLVFDAVSSTASVDDGINLVGLGAGTFSAASGAITGAAGIAFDLEGGSGAITYPGALNNGAGQTAEITSRTGGAVTLSGAIADTNDAGGGISLSGNSGGSTTFSNVSKAINSVGSAAVSFTGSDGHALTFSGGGLDLDATSGAGINATDSGTLTVNGAGNSVATATGTAVNVSNTDLGGATFQSISANGAANGISLTNTGTTAGLTVTGVGSTTQGGDNSGGTIQSTAGHGISLTNTTSPSFRNMHLQNTGNSGVNGTQVDGFSFTDGRITGAGDASDENSITFDDSLTATPNLTGTVTITNNVISLTEAEGIDIENWAGTISDANISNNALSDTGDVATPGSAITLIGSGLPASAANITKATVANNTIGDFRAGVGVQVRAGNPNAGAPTGSAGTAGSATNVIAITGNSMNGGNGGIGNQPDRFFTGGVSGNGGQGNFNVSNNGTAANRIRMIDCIAIEMQVDGPVTMTSTVQNNFINANSAVGCAGIAVGTDDPSDLGAGTHSTLISGNNVMGTDGPGIFPIVRDSGSTMTARVLNNTVAAPIATNAARAGIRVDSGSAAGDTTLCLEISGNTTAGSTNNDTATTSPGINLRKQGTDPAVNTFGIEGMVATASPGVENFVNGLNTSTSGTFGVGGTALLSAQSGFTSCVAP